MAADQLIPRLFRTEYSKMVAVLCKTYGLTNIQLAEDIVSDTFMIATETWGLKGIPQSPTAWLYTVAKNKTKDHFKHDKVFADKVAPDLQRETSATTSELHFTDDNIADSQLLMLFAVCNPILPAESQVALALRVLCGFGIDEIAHAFLSNKETINKRLSRAKSTFKTQKIELKAPSGEALETRIDHVLAVLYLLFNEGYYSSSSSHSLKKDLCLEAMRLNYLLLENPSTNLPKTNALMALLCFHSSRFDERMDNQGDLVLYADQDQGNWDNELIEKGECYLQRSAQGEATKYHLEAGISFWHTKPEGKDKWENILQLYNQLLQIEYSPIIALNRTYALSKANTKQEAIAEALKVDLTENHLYHALLADLYESIDQYKQKQHLQAAIKLANNESEKRLLQTRLDHLE